MEFHKTCKTLSIYSFSEILKTNDLRFLIKEYNEYDEKEIKLFGSELNEAKEIFKDIVYEYSELTVNKSVLQNYLSQINIEKEEFRYNITEKILNFYAESGSLEILETLNKLDWNINLEGDLNKQIETIVASMKRFNTKINVLKLKYKEKFENKKNKNEDSIDTNLDYEAISLEIALKISYSINTKETSVAKWISMWNVAEKINKKTK